MPILTEPILEESTVKGAAAETADAAVNAAAKMCDSILILGMTSSRVGWFRANVSRTASEDASCRPGAIAHAPEDFFSQDVRIPEDITILEAATLR